MEGSRASMAFYVLAVLCLLRPALSSRAAGWSFDTDYTSTAPRDVRRSWIIQVLALTCSTLSMLASIITFFWFARMEKRFRHRLIMLLIYGDVMRATWYFVYAVGALSKGQVGTESAFCQASGFFIQYGTETSDYAVLVIAVHSALQVFHPMTQSPSDGLYPYRVFVYIGALVIPGIMAGLAFINPNFGYLTVGAFCTLPLRPFWYRLALMWVPRYLIATIIIGLAIAIYSYVGFEFWKYAKQTSSLNNSMLVTTTAPSISIPQGEKEGGAAFSAPLITIPSAQHSRRSSVVSQDIVSPPPRRPSAVSFVGIDPIPERVVSPTSRLSPHSPSTSTTLLSPTRSASARNPLSIIPSGDSIHSASSSDIQVVAPPPAEKSQITPSPVIVNEKPASLEDRRDSRNVSINSHGQRQMDRQRARVYRQLRLLFIYPLVYTLMWLLPFAQHCSNYEDKYVIHPIWALRVGATLCMTIMGFVDCLIFSVREKPWRSIQTSDGTLWGSFAVFRRTDGSRHASSTGWDREMSVGGSVAGDGLSRQQSNMEGITRVKNGVRISSGSNGRTQIANSDARARLELEKEDRLAIARARIFSYAVEDTKDSGSEYSDHREESPTNKSGNKKGKGKALDV